MENKIPYIDIHTHDHTPSHHIKVVNLTADQIKQFLENQKPLPQLFSLGIHPWHMSTNTNINDSHLEELKGYLAHPNCVAIGETGLDRLYPDTFEEQKRITTSHIQIAKKLNKPIIFHCVKAYQDLYEILQRTNHQGNLLLHDYNGNRQTTNQFLRLNTYFSFGKKLFEPQTTLIKNFESIPSERILLETDDQKQYQIERLYQQYKKITEQSLEQIQNMMKQNFKRFTSSFGN